MFISHFGFDQSYEPNFTVCMSVCHPTYQVTMI